MNPIVTKIAKAINKRSCGILAGAAIAGFFGATLEAVRVTPAANLAIDNATVDKGRDLKFTEKAKIYGKFYWRSILIALLSAAAVVGSVKLGAKKRAALEAALAITTNALSSQTEKLIEKYGKDALNAVEGAVAKERIEKKESEQKKIEMTSTSDTVYHDAWTGYEFETTPTRIIEGVSEANMILGRDDELSINEFFDGIAQKRYEDESFPRRMGDVFGWSTVRGRIELEYTIIDSYIKGGKTHIIMGFNHKPLTKLSSC